MANANPSRPGINQTGGRMEVNVPVDAEVIKRDDGETVLRTEFQTGTIRETNLFPGDHPTAKPASKPASKGKKGDD